MYKLWTFFNIIIITIPGSKRIPILKNNLHKLGIINYEIREFKSAKKIINDGGQNVGTIYDIYKHNICDETCQNIATNHLKLIKEAYEKNWDNILILEDDALFDNISPKRLFNVISWLTRNPWDMFYFGYCPWPILATIPINQNIVKVFSPYCAHCYDINKSGIRKLMNNLKNYNKEHIDYWYTKQKNILKYAIFPAINFQSEDPALFRKATKKIGINISFKSVSKLLEILSIIIPIFIVFFIIFMFYMIRSYY